MSHSLASRFLCYRKESHLYWGHHQSPQSLAFVDEVYVWPYGWTLDCFEIYLYVLWQCQWGIVSHTLSVSGIPMCNPVPSFWTLCHSWSMIRQKSIVFSGETTPFKSWRVVFSSSSEHLIRNFSFPMSEKEYDIYCSHDSRILSSECLRAYISQPIVVCGDRISGTQYINQSINFISY